MLNITGFRARLLASVAAVGSFALVAPAAQADVITQTLGFTNNGTLAGDTPPYAQLQVSLINSTTANITFTGLTGTVGGSPGHYFLIDGAAADLNVNASTFKLTNFSATGVSGFGAPSLKLVNGGNVDGLGQFNLSVNLNDGFGSPASALSFTLTDLSGTWS